MRGRLKNLDVRTPALLIWGDRDAFLTKRTAEWTRRYVPNLKIEYVKGASHWVQQDSPETVNQYVLDFLKSPLRSSKNRLLLSYEHPLGGAALGIHRRMLRCTNPPSSAAAHSRRHRA